MASLIVSASSGGKDFEIHPAGVTAARCTRIIDLGTVDGEYKGKAKKSHKIMIQFESATVMGDDNGGYAGQPFLISAQYTPSLSDKAVMRKDLESWRGRKFTSAELDKFDLKNILGKTCMVNMVHSDPTPAGKVYSNIASIMPLPAAMPMPAAVNGLIFFSLQEFEQESYDKLSDYYKERIALSDEWKARTAPAPKPAANPRGAGSAASFGSAGEPDDSDIPF